MNNKGLDNFKSLCKKRLIDIRVAFMMAWHPCLGAKSIVKHLNKDIGKLIANKYITLERMLYEVHSQEYLYDNNNNIGFQF